MAYYSSVHSGSDYGGEYNFNSYAANYDYDYDYDYAQVPDFMTYNSNDYNQVSQPYYGYDQSLCFTPNYPDQCYQTVSYSATTFSDPKSLVYDPNYGMSQLVISYSNLEFNEPEFEEYDPTPYGGGYDIVETYGKPLPPSDQICHPRSGGPSSISIPIGTVPAGSILPLPVVKEVVDEKAIKPQNGTAGQVTDEKPQSNSKDIIPDQAKVVEDKSHDSSDYEGEEDSEESDDDEDDNNSSGAGHGFSGGQYDEHEKQVVPQYPSGYGLETVDLCESLFGNWPCLSRMKREQHCQEVFGGNNYQDNMWQGTADYLFGNPYPYGGRGEYGSSYGGNLVYGYERHYPSQAQSRQIDYTDGSW